MPETILKDIYRIEVPLPNSPLKIVNCYVIKGKDRDLVIDTGMNRSECLTAMEAGLKELDVDPRRADYFITHLHSDHMGLVSRLAGKNSTVYFNRREADMMKRWRKAGRSGFRMGEFAKLAGLDPEELKKIFTKKAGFGNQASDDLKLTMIEEGDPLEIGEYRFECVQTPGHSPGHMCLLDREKRLMICGDHVLEEISPNISTWDKDDNPLGDYLASLDKVYDLPVDLALPGHRRMIENFRRRIDELKEHHKERLEEVLKITDGTPMIAHDVAAQMTWDMRYDHWDDVAMMQKWFATGEAIAHLRHLEGQGLIRSEIRNERIVYSAR